MMVRSKIHTARPCALCQTTKVEKDPVCVACIELWGVRLQEPWAIEMVRMSEDQAKLIRKKKARESPFSILR